MFRGHVSEVRKALRSHIPYLAVVTLYVVAGVVLLRSVGQPLPRSVQETYGWPVTLAVSYLFVTFIFAIIKHVFIARRRPGQLETWQHLLGHWMGTRRVVGTLVVLISIPLLLNAMYGLRLSLTLLQPFYLDPAFMRLDAWLHGGHQPWELLQPLVGYPGVTRVIDLVYVYGWFVALWLGMIWQTVHGPEPVRSQFLLTFALAWILLGTGMATAMSSAGPAFFGRVTGLADPYEPLMAYLGAVDAISPLRAVAIQEKLWTSYTEWGGMSAMPSMHLSIVTAIILAGIRTHRWLAWVLLPFGILILIGSIHLGWHYAIDSYVGIGATAAIWWVSGRILRRWNLSPGGAVSTRTN